MQGPLLTKEVVNHDQVRYTLTGMDAEMVATESGYPKGVDEEVVVAQRAKTRDVIENHEPTCLFKFNKATH